MDPNTSAGRTLADLTAAIIADLSDTYDLVYVQQGDRFTTEQVSMIVRGDWESLWSSTDEWEDDQRTQAVDAIVKEALETVINRWEREDDADYSDVSDSFTESIESEQEVRDSVYVRDTSNWATELANASGTVLLRIPIEAIDEDHSYFHETVSPADVLSRLGMTDSEHNVATIGYVLDNADPEYSLLMGYWVVGATVSDLFALPADVPDLPVTITDPHLYLGNPFAGSGFVSEEPIRGTVTIKRSELRTDSDAFGYSLDKVYGGLNPSDFEARIQPVTADSATA
jgi:hypothetical protein